MLPYGINRLCTYRYCALYNSTRRRLLARQPQWQIFIFFIIANCIRRRSPKDDDSFFPNRTSKCDFSNCLAKQNSEGGLRDVRTAPNSEADRCYRILLVACFRLPSLLPYGCPLPFPMQRKAAGRTRKALFGGPDASAPLERNSWLGRTAAGNCGLW